MIKQEIDERLTKSDSLFNKLYVFSGRFTILPNHKKHFGAAVRYQDIYDLSDEFVGELVDSVVDWVYGSDKYKDLVQNVMQKGKTDSAAHSEIIRKAKQKFRKSDDELLIQGQLGELLLFHFIQRFFFAVPLLRKMKITTSSQHERFGADAIHYKVEEDKNIIILGEAKTYTSKYKFNEAMKNSIDSILDSYHKHRKELNLYIHEDFLDKEMNIVAESYLSGTMQNVEVHLVSLVVYNENVQIRLTNEKDILEQIKQFVVSRFNNFDNTNIDLEKNPILNRITYIAFPVWGLESLAKKLQDML